MSQLTEKKSTRIRTASIEYKLFKNFFAKILPFTIFVKSDQETDIIYILKKLISQVEIAELNLSLNSQKKYSTFDNDIQVFTIRKNASLIKRNVQIDHKAVHTN